MVKIAYIVLCHKNPDQINELIIQLLKNDADVYIHVDLKSNIANEIMNNENVYILSSNESYSVNWGGNDMILATLSLIRHVKNTNKEYDYIWLLSGQDYPIVSADVINNILSTDKMCNYIDVIDKRSNEYNRYKKLYEIWYPKWITKNNFFIKSIKRLYMLLTGGFNYTFRFFRRKKTFNFDFYFGSQWWTLTTDCAYYILDYCDNNPDYIKYFDNSIIPDECFFQTLFMSSPYSNNRKDNLTFVNWKDNRRSPETLTIKDVELLKEKSNNKCFARKFDRDVDDSIINNIKERINGE